MTYEEIVAQMQEAVVGIRKAIYGVEVREHIAVAMENVLEVGQRVIDAAKSIVSSEANAKASADRAQTSAENAETSETNAENSKKIAERSAGAARTSETNARASEEKAEAAANRAAVIAGGTDETLSTRGAAADAKAVGEALKNYLGIRTVMLAAGGWVSSDDMPGYPYKYTAVLEAASASMLPSAVPVFATLEAASEAGLANVCETQNGTVSFWAENIPTGDIRLQVSLIGQSSKEG